MDIPTSLRYALEIALLKLPAMRRVAQSKTALKPALLVTLVAAFATALGPVFFPVSLGGFVVYRPDLWTVFVNTIFFFFVYSGSFYLVGYLVEHFFVSKLPMQAYVQIMGFASLIAVLRLVPDLSLFVTVWMALVVWKVLSEVAQLEKKIWILLILVHVLFITLLT